ncbi:MAG TPA: hypothetical protein VFB72_13775, partial [Verrucomicrobiae bacterium]|nr:hypothetical protein [Verrucomicrobiae bacterium]
IKKSFYFGQRGKKYLEFQKEEGPAHHEAHWQMCIDDICVLRTGRRSGSHLLTLRGSFHPYRPRGCKFDSNYFQKNDGAFHAERY